MIIFLPIALLLLTGINSFAGDSDIATPNVDMTVNADMANQPAVPNVAVPNTGMTDNYSSSNVGMTTNTDMTNNVAAPNTGMTTNTDMTDNVAVPNIAIPNTD